jgi:hypothetical protein
MNPILQTMGQEFLCRLSVFLLIFRFLSFSRKPLDQIEQIDGKKKLHVSLCTKSVMECENVKQSLSMST